VQGVGRIYEHLGGCLGICLWQHASASFDLRCYTCNMSSKLSAANPYLRDPVARRRIVLTSVSTSSAIEGIHAPFKQAAVTPASGSAVSTQASPTPRRHVTRPKP